MLAARLHVPAFALHIGPDALSCRLSATVVSVEVPRLHHPKAPARLWAERLDQVARLGQRVHPMTVDEARDPTPMAKCGLSRSPPPWTI